MSCLTEMMLLSIVSPNGDRAVDHRLLLGVASSSDRSWLHRVRGVTLSEKTRNILGPKPSRFVVLLRGIRRRRTLPWAEE